MRRTLLLLLLAGAIALASGCGGSRSGSTTHAATSPGGAAAGGSAGASGSASGATSPGASLTAIRPPKYASPPAGAPVRSGVVQIAYRNIAIHPDAIRVRVGSTIRWTNFDTVTHNVTSRGGSGPSGVQAFASGSLAPGTSFTVRVTKPEVIHYLCTIYPVTMNGTIEVVS